MASGKIKNTAKGIKTPFLFSQNITSGVSLGYQATTTCLAIITFHIVASSSGTEKVSVNGVNIINKDTNGSCNYIDNIIIPLKTGDHIGVYASTGATDSVLSIAEFS